jgi:hypothetical protein
MEPSQTSLHPWAKFHSPRGWIQAINKSLSALGDVISALATEQPHIPYRNHKLTMLMSDSLGGNAKTLMFVNVSPSANDVEETQNSLTYATRVRAIINDASKNVSTKVHPPASPSDKTSYESDG